MPTSGLQSAPRAVAVAVEADALVVELADRRSVRVPLDWFPTLQAATVEQRRDWRLIGGGIGIHWPTLDEDVSVAALLSPE